MINSDNPRFITFEGGEGSGKSTQSRMLYQYLLKQGVKALHTREVGGTTEAEKIRELLVYSELLPISELMLVMAARHEHINKVIVPALLDGFWVICDRYIDSTACYQSGDSGLTMEDIYELHDTLMTISEINSMTNITTSSEKLSLYKGLMPDLTFFMDMTPQICIDRLQGRENNNKFDAKNSQFHQMIYDRFQNLVSAHSDRIIAIDCLNKSIEDIHQDIVSHIASTQ